MTSLQTGTKKVHDPSFDPSCAPNDTNTPLRVPIIRLPHAQDIPMPAYATPFSAGMDLCAAIESDIILAPHKRALIPTGLSIALPPTYEAQIRPRSGLALRHGISVLNTPGTIDSDYRGEICVILINLGEESFTITPKLRIAQMVIARYTHITWEETTTLPDSTRGAGGFGSTGTS